MKRFKKDVIFGSNRYDKVNADISIPYNDDRMYFKIPDNEEVLTPIYINNSCVGWVLVAHPFLYPCMGLYLGVV